ncbi:MAG: DUF1634 domain-containing protein [Proteobacteria bacterium]|nr:DUF1634 domain-containing protein [Pseudomonadota bacterium]
MADIKELRKAGKASPEQIRYANMVFWGAWLAIAIMILTYTAYMTGAVKPFIPVEDISRYWAMPASEYIHESGAPTGWSWVALLGHGDYMNFLGIALLAVMTIVCFLGALLPAYIKKKDWIFSGIVILEVLVLTLAASGILGGGGH